VYIDDGSDGSGLDGELTAEVNGQEYTAAETVDYDHDGVLDAADVDTPDGGHLLYVDSDGDGSADEAITYAADGTATAAADYDPGSGDWVASEVPGRSGGASIDPVAGGDLHVDTAAGTVDAGTPTVDSDGDGTDDTAIVHGSDGSTILYTDMDSDGSADVATVIGPDGSAETLHHTGEHEWTPVDGGPPSRPAVDPTSDGFWGAVGAAEGARASVLRIDSETGQWISPN
jgi:hypothetical protein